MSEPISVLLVNKSIDEPGIVTNAAFVLGLTAGRMLPDHTFGPEVVDGDGSPHTYLTRIAHFVRKATPSKLKTLRDTFAEMPDVQVIDYTEDAAPSTYEIYQESLGAHSGEEIVYRAVWVYGPEDKVVPLTKNLSRL